MISWMMKIWVRSDPSKKDFSPPTLIEKFQQPIIKSEPFTGFEVDSNSLSNITFHIPLCQPASQSPQTNVNQYQPPSQTISTTITTNLNHCQPISTTITTNINHCQPISTNITNNINHHHNQYKPLSQPLNPGPLCPFPLSLYIFQARAAPVSEGA